GADTVRNPHRLFVCIEALELPLVVRGDLLESAWVQASDRPRPAVPNRREIPSVAEVAPQLRLTSLRLPPFVSEHAVPEPFLAPELRPSGVLRGTQRQELLESVVQFGFRTRLVDPLLEFLFFLRFLRLLGGLLLFLRLVIVRRL